MLQNDISHANNVKRTAYRKYPSGITVQCTKIKPSSRNLFLLGASSDNAK